MANKIQEKLNFMKPGLAYIDERTKQFRYADDTGGIQWTQPISRYKALTEIKRGQAVSVATKDELYNCAYETTANKTFKTYELIAGPEQIDDTQTSKKTTVVIYANDECPINYKYTTITTLNDKGEQVPQSFGEFYKDGVKVNLPLTNPTKVDYGKDTEKTVYNFSNQDDKIYIDCTTYVYDKAAAEALIGDPESCVVPTNTKKHEKSIGLALEYASGPEKSLDDTGNPILDDNSNPIYDWDYIHAASFGKFTFDTDYEGVNTDFFKDTEEDENGQERIFDHTGKEYNPGFTYKDAGKKVYVKCPYTTKDGVEHLGELTLNETETYKNYHNIICIGLVTDAPDKDVETKTTIEIAISGDQRGLVDSTQFEVTLGEDLYVSTTDPIRVLANGQEEDTKFKARIGFTPQGTGFSNSDFIAFQKMDGKTAIIKFGNDVDLTGSSHNEDAAFLHMAQSYIDIINYSKEANEIKETISVFSVDAFNDTVNDDKAINDNIKNIKSSLENAFKAIIDENLSGDALTINVVEAATDNFFGYIEIEATFPGGYYTLYVSETMRAKLDGTCTLCGGSYENKGKAVLADIRIPTRRSLIGIYYGSDLDTLLKKGDVTLALRLGEYDIPDINNNFSTWEEGQEYYLGTNGRVVTKPYNQFDFVSKIGFVKVSASGDKRFLVDVGSATRHYNGDLPVGYMKPSVRVGTEYVAEYGFVLMDGKTHYKVSDYSALYTRILGWFDEEQIKPETGRDGYFRVPKVVRMMPSEEIVNGKSTLSQIEVPMQIKAIESGIYEEMPRIPFKRLFGKFKAETPEDEETVRATIEAYDITDLVDYGINENGYTNPGLDTLDIHLFVDIDENYNPNGDKPHDWREVHEGFFNYNNSNTYGYTWKIEYKGSDIYHPYGCYELVMDIGEGAGVAYVTDKNQSPLKLTGCYYKLYVARREVFARQFDIEGIYRNYITDSVYTDASENEVVLKKAVSGKAVLDAIHNIKAISNLTATDKNATINLGSVENPINELTIHTSTELPIISDTKIVLKNSKDENAGAVEVVDGRIYKANFKNENILDYTNGKYTVDDNEFVTAWQARQHAEATIDSKTSYTEYINKTNSTGRIHGMVFGRNGNIDVNSVWGFKPTLAHNINIDDESNPDGYINVVVKDNNGDYISYIEGDIKRVISGEKSEVLTETLSKNDGVSIGIKDDNGKAIVSTDLSTGPVVVKATKIEDNDRKILVENITSTNTIQKIYNTENGSLQLLFHNGATHSGLNIYAGNITSASLSKYKRIHGELIRDTSLTPNDHLADGSIKYKDEDNKLKTTLGSALQAAYELPLAYWQYNTEKEWSKDSLGIIIERVKDVATKIKGNVKEYFATLEWNGNTATAKKSGISGNNLSIKVLNVSTTEQRLYIYNNDVNVLGSHTDEKGTLIENFYTKDNYNINDFINFNITSWNNLEKTSLDGGKEPIGLSRKIINNLDTNSKYVDNEFTYTSEEENSISEFLSTIIDNSENGQNITSTVGMLLMAAKESQERLLKLEASTFGRDYETIPGGHKEYSINIPGVSKDPTNYGLNRLVRAICMELYQDSNPFDINGNITSPTSSLSRIDHINQDIHGRKNDSNNTDHAPNELSDINASNYPYSDMVNDPIDTDIRLGTSNLEGDAKEVVIKRGKDVTTRVDIDLSEKDDNGNYIGEKVGNNVADEDATHFNGIVDAIYRITTKLDALTVSVNNSDNIADRPVRLDTIRSNIATLLEEAFFNGKETTKLVNGKYETSMNTENDYKDVFGEENKPYPTSNNESRLEKLSKALYNYTLKLTQSSTVLGLAPTQKFGGENKLYTTRVFNGKQLLVTDMPDTSGATTEESVNMAIPTNIENYEYANVIDILIDAIGDDWLRKKDITAVTTNATAPVAEIETRSGKTITERLVDIEKCLDVIVSKISRQHNFEAEINNGIDKNDIDSYAGTKLTSENKVYSIEKYLGFLNEYLGTEQHTNDTLDMVNPPISSSVEQAWVPGIDKIGDVEFDLNKNVKNEEPISIGTTRYGAEWAIKNKKNIQAGLVNMLARLQREESISTAFGKMLGEDFDWQAANIQKKVDEETGVVTWVDKSDTSKYTLTDDIKDILLTLYGQDTDEINDTSIGYIVDNLIATKHRGLVNSNNNVNRFVADGKNIVDAIVNEMYYIPQPIRLENGNYVKVTANTSASLDSRSANFYDFDAGNNVYDIINNEKALGYGNRNEFFNDIGYFTDNETEGNNSLHYRLSRFEVLEKEIRSLRKLIGNNLSGNYINTEDWLALKFNGELRYANDKFNDVISTSIDDNDGSQKVGDNNVTSILQFLLNNDAANRKLRNELGGVGTSSKLYYDPSYKSIDTPNADEGKSISYTTSDGDKSIKVDIKYPLYENNEKTIYDRILTLENNATQVDAWIDSIKDNYRDTKNGNKQGNIFDIVGYLGNYTWEQDSYYGSFGKLEGIIFPIENVNNPLNTEKLNNYTTRAMQYKDITNNLAAHNEYIKHIYNVIGYDINTLKTDFVSNDDLARDVAKSETLWARINAVETLNKNDVDITNIVSVANSIPLNTIRTTDNTSLEMKSLDTNDSLTTKIDEINPKTDKISNNNQTTMVTSIGYVDNAINVATNKIINRTGEQVDCRKQSGVWFNVDSESTGETYESVNAKGLYELSHQVGFWYNFYTITDKYTDYGKKGLDIKADESFTENLFYIDEKFNTVNYNDLVDGTTYYIFDSEDEIINERNKKSYIDNNLLNIGEIKSLINTFGEMGNQNRKAAYSLYKRVDAIYKMLGHKYTDTPSFEPVTTGSLLTWDKNNNYDGTPSKAEIDAFIDSCTYESYSSNWPDTEYYTWLNPDDNVRFANFRKLPGCLNAYRGASPCCNDKGRKDIASSVVEANGINCILNLEDTEDEFNKTSPSDYIQSIYDSDNMAVDFYNYDDTNSEANRKVLGSLITRIAEIMAKLDNPKLYIHCVEGKFRAAFVSFLFECLCEASYEQMEADFMESYYNYYGVRKASSTDDTYTANRMNAYYYAGVKKWFTWDLKTVFGDNYTTSDLSSPNMKNKAIEYLKGCGVSDATITSLINSLTKNHSLLNP